MLTLVASRSVWSEGEPIDLQASLIFEAGEPRIPVAGSGSGLISFSLQELNGRRKVEGAATSDCRFYTMARGVPVSTRYTKSGGFSDGDPDAAWVRAFLQDPMLRLPKGRWRVTAYSDFFEQTCDSYHAHRQISVSLDFEVTSFRRARHHSQVATSMRVRLRDVTLADAELIDGWNRDPERSPYNDFGEPFSPLPRAILKRGPLRDGHNGMLMIERNSDGAPIGTIGWHRVQYGPNAESVAWNIGIELRPEFRGVGLGTESQRLMADWLFENTSVNRVEASTDVENVAEQRALEKAGYVREGIQRGAQSRSGVYHDLVTYSRLRDDP